MDKAEELSVFIGVSDCLNRYALACDDQDRSALHSVFTEDAVLEVSGMHEPLGSEDRPFIRHCGREKIADLIVHSPEERDGEMRRHFVTNFSLTSREDGRASAHAYFMVASLKKSLQFKSMGYYELQAVRDASGKWEISYMRIVLDAPVG